MIRGRFDHYRRPYVLGRLILPRWNIQGEVDFLVDTGADSTIIHPYDGHRLRVPFAELESEILSVGIGGRHPIALKMPFSFSKMALACANIIVRS